MTANRNSILVIDDDHEFLEKIRISMGLAGYKVLTVSNPEAALETFNSGEFGVVITDLCMPSISGLTVLKNILQAAPDTRVIVISGQSDEHTRQQSLRAGACAFLAKPLDITYLESTLKQLISQSMPGVNGASRANGKGD